MAGPSTPRATCPYSFSGSEPFLSLCASPMFELCGLPGAVQHGCRTESKTGKSTRRARFGTGASDLSMTRHLRRGKYRPRRRQRLSTPSFTSWACNSYTMANIWRCRGKYPLTVLPFPHPGRLHFQVKLFLPCLYSGLESVLRRREGARPPVVVRAVRIQRVHTSNVP